MAPACLLLLVAWVVLLSACGKFFLSVPVIRLWRPAAADYFTVEIFRIWSCPRGDYYRLAAVLVAGPGHGFMAPVRSQVAVLPSPPTVPPAILAVYDAPGLVG